MLKTMTFRTTLVAIACALSFSAHAIADSLRKVDVPAGELVAALQKLAQQAGVEFIYSADHLKGVRTDGARGEYTAEQAVTKLLEGTKLRLTVHESGALLISDAAAAGSSGTPKLRFRLARADQSQSDASQSDSDDSAASTPSADSYQPRAVQGIPEVLVEGARILNMDIARHRDDAQPYVIFDRNTIAKSGATSIEDFLKTRLPQNTANISFDQGAFSTQGAISQINLRGLGTAQTLILIDGHRAAPVYFLGSSGTPLQSDLNGIPLSSVERIEVLPTTASGIYGGSATGGVVNVILRRDYAGLETRVTYRNSFDTDAAVRGIDLAGGFNIEGGRTNILVAGSHTDRNSLLMHERDFRQRGLAHILATNNDNPQSLNTSGGLNPPLGKTTNIRSTTGLNLTLKNGTLLNSPVTHVPLGYAGAASDGGAALVTNAGKYNLNLANSAQGGGGRHSLLGEPTVDSISTTVRRQFSPTVQAFLEATASNSTGYANVSSTNIAVTLPATAPNNPFTQAIRVTVPTSAGDAETVTWTKNRRFVGGVIVKLPARWMGELDYTWNRTSNSYDTPLSLSAAGTAAITSGSIDVLRDTEALPLNLASLLGPSNLTLSPFRATLGDLAMRFSGPVKWFRPDAATVSALLEHRRETLDEANLFQLNNTIFFPERSQEVDSVYLEARLPLIAERDRVPAVRQLELQIAGRWDRYVTHGSGLLINPTPITPILRERSETTSTNPTVGLRYQPFGPLLLRASYGRGFLPPAVSQLVNTTQLVPSSLLASVADPRRGNTGLIGTIALVSGGNPDLLPEESKSWSAGAVLTPHFIAGLRLSVDYTNIEKVDNITSLNTLQLLANESILPGRITRGPNLPGDPSGWAGPITQINSGLMNLSLGELEAYDVQVDYSTQSARAGAFDFFALGTWQMHHRTQLIPTAAVVDNVGLSSNFPLKFKANVGLNWTHGPWSVGWSANYYHSYLVADPALAVNAAVIANQGNGGRIPSQTYHDVFAGYRLGNDRHWVLRDTELQAGVRNLFNEKPPVDLGIAGGSTVFYSTFGDPRLASYHLSLKRSF